MSTRNDGEYGFATQAIVLVPLFTYIVEALLGVVGLFAAFLLAYNLRRPTKLPSDPASIAATMSIVANDEELLMQMQQFDRATASELCLAFKEHSFETVQKPGSTPQTQIRSITSDVNFEVDQSRQMSFTSDSLKRAQSEVVPGVQPTELTLKIGAVFLIIQVVLLATLAALFI